MTKLEKHFLNCCIKYYSECSVISSDDLLKYIDVPLISLQRCAQHLEQNGYIKNLHIQMRIRFNFQLTYEGSFYNEVRSDRIKDFFIEIRLNSNCNFRNRFFSRCFYRLPVEHA